MSLVRPSSTQYCLSRPILDEDVNRGPDWDLTVDKTQTDTGVVSHIPYEERVGALEDELGISTSDAQAMVDAEDLLSRSAPWFLKSTHRRSVTVHVFSSTGRWCS